MLNYVVYENGVQREPTAEEIAEMEHMAAEMPAPAPDPDAEWKQLIESALLEIGSILGGA